LIFCNFLNPYIRCAVLLVIVVPRFAGHRASARWPLSPAISLALGGRRKESLLTLAIIPGYSERMRKSLLVLAGGALVAAAFADSPPVKPADFARDVQPIFAKHCLTCHGPDKQKNGLRLDSAAAILHGGDSGPPVVAGKPNDSLLLTLVSGTSPDGRVMPPKGDRLSAGEIETLKSWIAEGAKGRSAEDGGRNQSSHWSFQPIKKPTVPAIDNRKSQIENPIDAFIRAKLNREGVAPSPEADRPTLIRRLCLDLTGLPPTLKQIDEFQSDRGNGAYDRLVERLLASPHFGEQWARHWLDLARYADSDGYEKDLDRPHAWRWRDWVIAAINADIPFDQFTIEQIAGDLLPNTTVDQRIATGFHRNTLLNREGGVDIEEDRVKSVVDRVSTVGSVWLGLTVGCAECHSHKFDPISQREFYQLYAFFNSTEDRDISAPVNSNSASVAERNWTDARSRFVDPQAWPDDAEFEAWRASVRNLAAIWWLPDSYELPTFGANNGANLYPQEDGSFLVTGTVDGATHYIMMSNTRGPRAKKVTAIRVEALTDEMLPKFGPGWAPNGNFVLSELLVKAADLADVNNLKKFPVARAIADYSQRGYEITHAIDGDEKTGWAVDQPHLPVHGVDRCAVFVLKEPIELGGALRLKVSLVQHHGSSHTLGRLRVSYCGVDPAQATVQTVPQRIRDLAASRSDEATLRQYYLATLKPDDPRLKAYTDALADRLKALGSTKAQVLAERATPRPTHIHIRGDFLRLGDSVSPRMLAVLYPSPPASGGGGRKSRLDLARWLVDPANPLTARVTVNRVWRHLFGQGLVATVSDFGTQGDKPSHPELLDWLADDLVHTQHWSMKGLIRQIVTSATYKQSSSARPELTARDAKNRWLARQNRIRLPAENVRDQFLAASGLLNTAIGGPSVPTSSHQRGLYVKFKRSTPEAMLTTFDAPAATVTCPARERSNTPLQALTLLNDPLYVECAQALAKRMIAEVNGDGPSRIRFAVRAVLARDPDDVESARLMRVHDRAREVYAEAKSEDAELAAWAAVARTILNLDEVVTRE
jgi:mono/diheme cytochrome c family protein